MRGRRTARSDAAYAVRAGGCAGGEPRAPMPRTRSGRADARAANGALRCRVRGAGGRMGGRRTARSDAAYAVRAGGWAGGELRAPMRRTRDAWAANGALRCRGRGAGGRRLPASPRTGSPPCSPPPLGKRTAESGRPSDRRARATRAESGRPSDRRARATRAESGWPSDRRARARRRHSANAAAAVQPLPPTESGRRMAEGRATAGRERGERRRGGRRVVRMGRCASRPRRRSAPPSPSTR